MYHCNLSLSTNGDRTRTLYLCTTASTAISPCLPTEIVPEHYIYVPLQSLPVYQWRSYQNIIFMYHCNLSLSTNGDRTRTLYLCTTAISPSLPSEIVPEHYIYVPLQSLPLYQRRSYQNIIFMYHC